jgi:hypothetical protein
MAYVKISDPKIIDLPTVHQIINVVNQHSDNISALTNNFGSVYSGTTTSGATTEYQFDLSSQQIFYGQTKFNTSSTGFAYNSGLYLYTVPVTFIAPFSSSPIVLAQPIVTSASTNYLDLIVNVTNIGPSSCTLSLRHAGKNSDWLGSGTINVNWIAIGHK